MKKRSTSLRDKPRNDSPATAGLPTSRKTKVVELKRDVVEDVLARLQPPPPTLALPGEVPPDPAAALKTRWNATLGCRTDEVALAALAQLAEFECRDLGHASEEQIDQVLVTTTAKIAELEPTCATETLLAVQMIGAQSAAMKFLKQATADGITFDAANRYVQWSSRLMTLFNEQVEAMAKLKGKSGQRIVVERVTVQDGGQAIVGAVIPGGRGTSGDNQR